jgi:hypothetical protein
MSHCWHHQCVGVRVKVLIWPLRLVRALALAVWRLVSLVHDGEADIRETYPDQDKPTGERAAVTGSLFSGMNGVGHP